ncbi:MAG TPA: O-antigen ligase family protein [Gemmatimonadales bacterium]
MREQPLTADGAPWAPPSPPVVPRPKARHWDLLLVCVAVYLATAVGRLHQLFPALLPLKPALVSAALAVGLFLLQQSGARRVTRVRGATTACVLGLLLWAALSVPGSLAPGLAYHFVTDSFIKAVVMYVVIAGCVRAVRDVERLALVYFAVTALYGAVVLVRFQIGGGDDWRLGHLYNYDANDFATLIATAMPLGLYFVLAERRLHVRALALAGLVVLAIGDIRTGSRGGFLALMAVAGFVLVRFTTIPARSRAAGLAIILAVVFFTASDRYWTQMQTVLNPHEDYNATSETGRLSIWKRGMTYMLQNPVLGVGAANFQEAEGTISPMARRQEYGVGVRWGAAHNSFVQVGAELGIPGLLLFIGLITSVFVSLRRVAREAVRSAAQRNVARLAQSLMAAMVGFVVGGFFLSLAFTDFLYCLVALAVALHKATRLDAQRVPVPV